MHYGSSIPITAFPDFDAVKDYVQTLEGEGFDFTSTSGHVLAQPSGTNPQRPDRQYVGPFYDPMVTFSYLAGVTQRIHFITGILILPAWPDRAGGEAIRRARDPEPRTLRARDWHKLERGRVSRARAGHPRSREADRGADCRAATALVGALRYLRGALSHARQGRT